MKKGENKHECEELGNKETERKKSVHKSASPPLKKKS